MSRFQSIGQLFSVDGFGLYLGQAIVSEEAIYLAAGSEPITLASLFSGRIFKPLTGDSGPFQIPLSDLPDLVIRHSDWPIKTDRGFVCIFTKGSITDLRCSFTGRLRITNLEHSAEIRSGVIKRFSLLRSLREFGWDV